jgi:hypothetical protein
MLFSHVLYSKIKIQQPVFYFGKALPRIFMEDLHGRHAERRTVRMLFCLPDKAIGFVLRSNGMRPQESERV